jgi:hypothetical protein
VNVAPGGPTAANIELAAGVDDAAQTGAVFFCEPRIKRSFVHFSIPWWPKNTVYPKSTMRGGVPASWSFSGASNHCIDYKPLRRFVGAIAFGKFIAFYEGVV